MKMIENYEPWGWAEVVWQQGGGDDNEASNCNNIYRIGRYRIGGCAKRRT
jgi:hypothetical protein